jgi:polysaccharide biosynthesis protein PslG
VVGTVDDALAQQDPHFAQAQADVSRDAGFDAAAVSATWKRGQRRPPASLVRVLRTVASSLRKAQMQLDVVVWNGLGKNTPSTPAARADFAAFAAAVVQSVPRIRDVIVGNEPNLSTFWEPQFGANGRDLAARRYADLLARSYDAIKAADPGVTVLGGALSPRGADRPGGTRPTHSPTAFIRDLGTDYRTSGRSRPLMDGLAFHPYMQASRIPPTAAHPQNTSITIADYPKLVALLTEAFHGTAQPGARLPIYYTEFGVQTRVPAPKLRFYVDRDSPERTDAVSFALQAAYYRKVLALAYCQPTVRGLFVFHTFDEPGLGGWQSGLYFADRTPKPSLAAFKRAVSDLRNDKLARCSR